MKKITLFLLSFISLNVYASGFLQVSGQEGAGQMTSVVKAVKCETEAATEGWKIKKLSCGQSFYFSLNKKQELPAGQYMVGYANTQYPGLVEITEGRASELQLETISIPTAYNGRNVIVTRDFSSLAEQKKLYMSLFGMGKHFFQMSENDGYFMLRLSPNSNVYATLNYDVCKKVLGLMTNSKFLLERSRTIEICQSFNQAKMMMDLTPLFDFSNTARGNKVREDVDSSSNRWIYLGGDFLQHAVSLNMDTLAFWHQKHAVGTPITSGDSVYVFAGKYQIVDLSAKAAMAPQSVVINGSEDNYGQIYADNLSLGASKMGVYMNSCKGSEQSWRTEHRSYCSSDSQEGCDRRSVRYCADMKQTKTSAVEM